MHLEFLVENNYHQKDLQMHVLLICIGKFHLVFHLHFMHLPINNYYGDSNSYSKYLIEDKKYECRPGPFEGFFVSSVEVCKNVKFYDKDESKRDNIRTGINSTNLYIVIGNTTFAGGGVIVPTLTTSTSFALCI